MTVDFARYLLAVVLVIGVAGNAVGPQTAAEFSDSHDGEGTFAAVSNFNSGGGPGGGGPGGGVRLVADAGGPYTVDEGSSVSLDPWDSTATRGIRSVSWNIVSGPGEIGSLWGIFPYYSAPDDVGEDLQVIIELTITDNSGRTDTDSAVVTVRDVDGSTGGSTSGIESSSEQITADESTPTTTPTETAETETETGTEIPSSTATETETATPQNTATETETATPTATPTATATDAETATQTGTETPSSTATETETATDSETTTDTEMTTTTETETARPTATATDTETATPQNTTTERQ